MTQFGAEFLGLCSLYGMVICNGMKSWTRLGGITCKTYNGQSVVDCVICSKNFISKLLEFGIGDTSYEMKSDHLPLLVKLGISPISQHDNQDHHKQKNIPDAQWATGR